MRLLDAWFDLILSQKKWSVLSILWISITIPLSEYQNIKIKIWVTTYWLTLALKAFVSFCKAFLCYYAYKMLVLKGFRFEKSTVCNEPRKDKSLKFVCTSSILYFWNWIGCLNPDGKIFHQNDGTSSENVVMYSSLKEYRISFQIKYIDIKQKMQAI